MTGPNSEFVRDWCDAFNRGELQGLYQRADPEIVWVVAREHPAATTHHGIDEVAAYHRDWRRTFPDLSVEIESVSERGDRVLAVLRAQGTGAGSSASAEVRLAILSTFRDGLAVRTEEFLDPDEARRVFEGSAP